MRKRLYSALLAVPMALVATVVAAPSAMAAASTSAIVYTDGTRAGEAFFNRANGTHGNKAWFDVHDAKCDASSVYVEYIVGSGDPVQKENEGGCHTTKGFNIASGRFGILYRVCVNNSLGNHPCSGWVGDNNY